MKRLQDLARRPVTRGIALPAWFERLGGLGIVTADQDAARRQRFANYVALACAANATSHLIINGVYGGSALWPAHLYNLLFALAVASTPLLHRHGADAAATAIVALVVFGNMFVLWLFGSASTLHVYFTLVGPILFMYGVENWRPIVAWMVVGCVAIAVALHVIPYEGVLAPEDEFLRQLLSGHAMYNAIAINALLFFVALTGQRRAEASLRQANERSEALIETMMPPRIADRLMAAPDTRIADRVDRLGVLIADLSGFTAAARAVPPEELVGFLDRLYQRFDAAAAARGCDKIKTMGDGYMAVAGLDGAGDAALPDLGRLALDLAGILADGPPLGGKRLTLRIGLHVGPATAGVIGSSRIAFDVWGEAVNVAARLEAAAAPGEIVASHAFRAATDEGFVYEMRGLVELKGMGTEATHRLAAARGA